METIDIKYKEKLRLAEEALESGSYDKDTIEHIFPELKDSKDERIRKRLLKIANVWKEGGYACGNSDEIDDIIAWLEKQGEPIDKIVKRATTEKQRVLLTETNGDANIDWDTRSLQDVKLLLEYGLDYVKKLEKQGEQKTVEPKFNFKVGDWITDGYLHCKISDVLNDRYIVDTKFAKRSFILFRCEHNYHLWTIEDAKDGDVIYEKSTESIILFKSEDCGWIDSYCSYWQKTKTFECGKRQYGRVSEMNICPATETQRERFFVAMGDAGYEWDAEKKQVIKS